MNAVWEIFQVWCAARMYIAAMDIVCTGITDRNLSTIKMESIWLVFL